MTKTNSSRFSRVALAGLLVLLVAASPVTAASVANEDVPQEAQVGTQITATITLDTLYQNPTLESWQLSGSTELTNVSWTVVYYDQTGSKVNQREFTGQQFSGAPVAADTGTSEVRVRITGTVPRVQQWSYDPPQEFRLMKLTQAQQGGASNTLGTWTTHHYTERSDQARNAIDEARAAIDDAEAAGANPKEARSDVDDAVAAYNDGSFDVAISLANKAVDKANSAKQSKQTRQTIIYAVAGLVVVGLLVGGFLYWRSQRQTYDRLG
ncbi:MAG: hypothetical protein ABEJ78_00760 [Haloferacaceae archaeon]